MKNIKKTIAVLMISLVVLGSCKKDSAPASGSQTTTTTTTTVNTDIQTTPTTPVTVGADPAIVASQGFFLNNWVAKTFTVPSSTTAVTKPSPNGAVNVDVDLSQIITKASTNIYGNNTNPFMGQYVTEPALMSGIKSLNPGILRAPGGSLSDVYFWNGDGKGNVTSPPDVPSVLLNNQGSGSAAGYWYGNNTQSWTFSLDNFYSVLQQTNSTALITVNYGYARYGTSAHPAQVAAHLAANWVRYDKGRTQYWEVGNENYGNWEAGYYIDTHLNQDSQPQVLTGTVYGTHFKIFADSMRAAALEVGNNNIKIGAVLTSSNDANNNAGVTNWNANVLNAMGNNADFFVVHNYYTPYNEQSSVVTVLSTPGPSTSAVMQWVKTSVQNAGVTQKPVALDEYNIQTIGGSETVSSIAGVHAVMVLGEALKDQYSMAARWDLANGWSNGDDQGMFNIGDEPGGVAKWNPRPAFYYMSFFQNYIGDRVVSSTVSGSTDINSYASSFTSGQAGVILVNTGNASHVVNVNFKNFVPGTNYYYYSLNGGTDNAPFSRKVFVNGVGPANGISGGPSNYASIPPSVSPIQGGITVTIPAYGVVYLVADK